MFLETPLDFPWKSVYNADAAQTEAILRKELPVETKLLAASPESIALGAELLRKGELVAFPTETV